MEVSVEVSVCGWCGGECVDGVEVCVCGWRGGMCVWLCVEVSVCGGDRVCGGEMVWR